MIRYTPHNLARASSLVISTRNGLQGDQDAMTAFLRRTLGSDWQGSASEGYQTCQAKWDACCEHHHQALHKFGAALDAAHHNASATERAFTQLWGG